MELTEAQRAALDFVRGLNPGRTRLEVDAPITINFHPDRAVAGRTVIEGLVADGRFRSQFETGISNGGLTAYPGGDRDRWEERMFGGAYQRPRVRPEDRPKYGALNLLHYDDGAAPRFGSAHLRLRGHVNERATFTFGDSYSDPTEAGTVDAFDAVRAAVLAHHGHDTLDALAQWGLASESGGASGRRLGSESGGASEPSLASEPAGASGRRLGCESDDASGPRLGSESGGASEPGGASGSRLASGPGLASGSGPAPGRAGAVGRALDDYVEAQVHGPVVLAEDVEALVLDDSFQGSGCGTADAAQALVERYGVRVEWRVGFRVAPGGIDPEFRGPEVPKLGLVLCERRGVGVVDAALIGAAARDVVADPAAWAQWGEAAEVLQLLKYLWHCLVRFG